MIDISNANLGSSEYGFIINTWLRSYHAAAQSGPALDSGQLFAARLEPDQYNAIMRPYIRSCLRESRVLLAHAHEDRDLYAGWVCGTPTRLDYVYVKKSFRCDNLCTELLQKLGLEEWNATYSLLTWPWFDTWLAGRGFQHRPQLETHGKHQTVTRSGTREEDRTTQGEPGRDHHP